MLVWNDDKSLHAMQVFATISVMGPSATLLSPTCFLDWALEIGEVFSTLIMSYPQIRLLY